MTTKTASTSGLPALTAELVKAGYYPQLVTTVLDVALGGEPVDSFLVQAQTTFDDEIRRHLTVLVLTPTRLVVAHVDDHDGDDDSPPAAAATTEAVPLSAIKSVGLTHFISEPAKYALSGAVPVPAATAAAVDFARKLSTATARANAR